MKMKLRLFSATIFILLFLSISFARETVDVPSDRDRINGVIKIMIHLIENDYTEELMLRYAEPSVVDRFIKKGVINETINTFSAKKKEKLLEYLESALNHEPQMNEESTRAVYEIQGKSRKIIFIKINNRWYLKN